MEAAEQKGRKKSIRQQWWVGLHPEENVEAEAKLSEAAERKRCPEGRGGRDRPVEVRIQQQAERCQELGPQEGGPIGAAEEAAPWLAVPQVLAASVCSRSPCQGPLLGHSPARRWHLNSSQRPGEGPSLIRACLGSSLSMTLLLPRNRLYYMDPTTLVAGNGQLQLREGR